MKIGVVVSGYKATSGGSYSFQSSILSALPTAANKHEFVLLDYSEVSKSVEYNGLRVIGLKSPESNYRRFRDIAWWMSRSGRALRYFRNTLGAVFPKLKSQPVESTIDKAIRQYELDIVWYLTPHAEPVSCPIFVTVWDLQHRLQPWFPEVSQGAGWVGQVREDHYQRILPRASRILTGTQVGKEEVIHFYQIAPENVRVIPFPAPEPTIPISANKIKVTKEKYGISNPYFFYPAQFWPHKNHINLLQAMKLLKDDGLSIPDLVLTGSDKGNRAFVERTMGELGLSENVKFLGFIDQEDMPGLYQEAIALVFPTFFGPDNLPPLEAFTYNCPVICSDVSGSEEQLGEAVLTFDPTIPEDIAQAMRSVSTNEVLCEALRTKGKARAKELTPTSYVMQICDACDELEPMIRCWPKE